MRRSLLSLLVLLAALLIPSQATFADENEIRLAELDAYWENVSRAVQEGDFKGYKATCHPEGVLVTGTKKTSYPLSTALAKWKEDFTNTKNGKIKPTVQFRFSQRLGDETTAHETGMFLYSVKADDKVTVEPIHFQALLVKRKGEWKILMEYQKSKGTIEEWNKL